MEVLVTADRDRVLRGLHDVFDSLRSDLGILRCLGKGSRERIVPVSKRSMSSVKEYVEKERPRLVRRCKTDLLFVSRGGKPLGREVIAAFMKKYALLAGLPGPGCRARR